jgi:hypothetical protein
MENGLYRASVVRCTRCPVCIYPDWTSEADRRPRRGDSEADGPILQWAERPRAV